MELAPRYANPNACLPSTRISFLYIGLVYPSFASSIHSAFASANTRLRDTTTISRPFRRYPKSNAS